MTPEEQRIAIAEYCGTAERWAIMKCGLYYRPNAKGYTNNIDEAWIVTEEEANKHIYPHDEPVKKQRVPLPDYLNDLNVIAEAERSLEGRMDYSVVLYNLVVPKSESLSDHFITWSIAHRLITATAAQRAEAFLRTIGKWKD